MEISNLVVKVDFCKVCDIVFSNGVGKKEMVLFEVRVLKLLPEEADIFFGRPDKIDSFEMHYFFLDVLNLLDEVDIIFIEFGLSVYDRDDSRGLTI